MPRRGRRSSRSAAPATMSGPDAKNKVGPLLNGIIGRKAGTIEGFAYSDANKAAGANGLVWTEEVLFKYLENPLTFMPGTKMAFAGLKDAQDRKDLIAYLKKFSEIVAASRAGPRGCFSQPCQDRPHNRPQSARASACSSPASSTCSGLRSALPRSSC